MLWWALFQDITLNPSLHHISISDSPYGLGDKRFNEVNGKGESLPFEKLLWHLSNDVNWFIMVMVIMMMMKEKGVHAVWAWWLIDGHRNLSCLEDIQTWDQSWFLSRPSQNIFFLAAATHRLPSLVPQPTCFWKWHPDTCRLGNPTTFTLSSWKGSEGTEITRKIYLISTSEIKARKEHFDQEAYPVPSIFSLSVQVLFKWKAHHKTPYRRAFAWESDFISRAVLEPPPVECTQFSWYPAFPSGEKSWYGNCMRRDDLSLSDPLELNCTFLKRRLP